MVRTFPACRDRAAHCPERVRLPVPRDTGSAEARGDHPSRGRGPCADRAGVPGHLAGRDRRPQVGEAV